jgi:hypothetical protein
MPPAALDRLAEIGVQAGHQERKTVVIDELVQCRCGHGISGHSGSGCEGDRLRPCSCRRTRADVLTRAIAHVHTDAAPDSESLAEYRPRIVTTK